MGQNLLKIDLAFFITNLTCPDCININDRLSYIKLRPQFVMRLFTVIFNNNFYFSATVNDQSREEFENAANWVYYFGYEILMILYLFDFIRWKTRFDTNTQKKKKTNSVKPGMCRVLCRQNLKVVSPGLHTMSPISIFFFTVSERVIKTLS